eukprot:2241706-Pyramimonas_sp.AAC.1
MERFLVVETLLDGLLRLSWGFLAAAWAVWRPSWASWNDLAATQSLSDGFGRVSGLSWGVPGALWKAWKAAPRRKTISGPFWPGTARGTFRLGGPRGRPARARTRKI